MWNARGGANRGSQRHSLRRSLLTGVSAGAVLAVFGFMGFGRADDVNLTTDTNDGVNLDSFSGTTVQVMPGVTITDSTFTDNCGTFSSLCASTRSWTLTNHGTIGPTDFGDGVHFTLGGSVINSGSIQGGNGVWITGGAGSVDNQTGATIEGDTGGVVLSDIGVPFTGSLTNAGTITSNGQAVGLNGGGTLNNLAGGLIQGHGQSNAVAIIDGTSRTVVNDGTIQSNDSGFATGVALQSGTLTNNAGGQILGAYNAIWANGAGATSITNSGYLEASQAQGGGSAIEVDAGGSVVNSGTIRSFTSNSTSTDAGISFTGAGSITNGGTIESTSGGPAISFNDASTHTLTLDTGSVLGGNVLGGAGTDHLVLTGTGSDTITRFLNFETLSMQGSDWAVTGTGAFATSVNVQSGSLRVNGQLTSPTVTVGAGGTLGGGGTVIGSVTANGTVAPGNSIGTLNITGNYTQAAGSTYAVQLDNTGASDLIQVTGTATIQAGSTVKALGAPGSYTIGTASTILAATGGVTGTYSTLTDNLPFVDFVLSYDPNDVFLSVLQNSVPLSAVTETPNQQQSAGAVASLGAGNPVFDAVATLGSADARHAFDLLSGEIHPTLKGVLFNQSADLRDAVADRLLQPYGGEDAPFQPASLMPGFASRAGSDCTPFFCTVAEGHNLAAWGRALGNWGSIDSDGNAGKAKTESSGFVSGVDVTFHETWRAGVAAGYSHTGIDAGSRASSASINSYHVAAYGGLEEGAFAARLGAAYTFNDIGTTRDVGFTGFSDTVRSDYSARTAQVFGEVGYEIRRDRYAIEPVAGLAYVNLDSDRFHEGSGPAALSARGSDDDILFSNLELRGATRVDAGSLSLRLHGMIGWRHAFGDVTPATTLTFDSGSAPFTVSGAPIARDAALIEAGADIDLTGGVALGLSYSGEVAPGSWQQGVFGDLRIRF